MPIGIERGDFGGSVATPAPDESVRVNDLLETMRMIVWTRWRTAEDERVCPECGPLDGATWPEDEGPSPPLHDGCRCTREFAFVELAMRVV